MKQARIGNMSESQSQPRLEVSQHCYLSPFSFSDRQSLVTCLNDEAIYQYTLRIPFPYTSDHANSYLNLVADQTKKDGFPTALAIREPGGSLIGGCGYEGLIRGHRVEIGYWLAKKYWGRQMMTGVVGAMCRHAFDQWNLLRITAHVFEENAASARVLEKNGFAFEGLLKKQHLKDGRPINSKLYALVR